MRTDFDSEPTNSKPDEFEKYEADCPSCGENLILNKPGSFKCPICHAVSRLNEGGVVVELQKYEKKEPDRINVIKNILIIVIVCLVISIYGGSILGVWFMSDGKVPQSNVDGDYEITTKSVFMMDTIRTKIKVAGEGIDEEDEDETRTTAMYDGSKCKCYEIDEVMSRNSGLAHLGILLAFGVLYITNIYRDSDNKEQLLDWARKFTLGIISIGIITALYFFFAFPNALNEDADFYDDMEKSPSIMGLYSEESEVVQDEDVRVFWFPGMAWFLMLIVVPWLGYSILKILRELESATLAQDHDDQKLCSE